MKTFCFCLTLLLAACATPDAVTSGDDVAQFDVLDATTATDAIAAEVPVLDAAPDATATDVWPAVGCTPGNDQTCNWLPAGIGLAGHCNADGTCTCKDGIGLEATTGKCVDMTWCDPKFVDSCKGNDTTTALTGVCQANGTCLCNAGFLLDEAGRCVSATCHGGCATEGATRCAGGFLQRCDGPANGCAHHWFTTDNCHLEICNATATQCVPKATTVCAGDGDCPCGCGCTAGTCKCSGALPSACASDAACGPACSGLICGGGKCVAAGAHP